MKKRVAAALAVLVLTLPTLAQAAPPATAPAAATAAKTGGKCEGLARDWRTAENYAAGVVDDSAPRATMRAAEDQASLLRADMTLQLMRDFRCPLPSRAPSRMTYALAAMKCRTERLKGTAKPPECDYSTWTSLVE